tara:strand:+ start:959 stop:1702 length:744 start_codon:yes stop_codon:yes gene_type:complete
MSDQNNLVCVLPCVPLRAEPNDRSEQVSQILSGEIVTKTESCEGNWIKIQSQEDRYEGYVDPRHFHVHTSNQKNRLLVNADTVWDRGAFKSVAHCGSYVYLENDLYSIGDFQFDNFDAGRPNVSIVDSALEFLGTPYHWGGKTKSGIDCSGLTQICARLLGVNLQRDASQQAQQGVSVDWEDREVGDLAFLKNKGSKITHVGILMNDDQIIHASGEVRIDGITHEGIIHSKTGEKTHEFSHIRRMEF